MAAVAGNAEKLRVLRESRTLNPRPEAVVDEAFTAHARRLRLAPNSVTTLVNGLHTKGLITRSTTTADARAVVLALTDAGQRAVETWKAANAAIVHTALGVLGPLLLAGNSGRPGIGARRWLGQGRSRRSGVARVLGLRPLGRYGRCIFG